MYFTLQDGDV